MKHTRASRIAGLRGGTAPPIAALAVLCALLFTSPAGATTTHPLIGSFGPDGTSGSEFPVVSSSDANRQLAFGQGAGRLLVAAHSAGDDDPDGVCQFASSGASPWPPVSFPAAGEPCLRGESFGGIFFGNPEDTSSVAVDNSGGPSDGNVYVRDAGVPSFPGVPQRIYGFDADGEPLGGAFPIEDGGGPFKTFQALAVDSAGHLWVSGLHDDLDDDFLSVAEFNPDGTPTGREADVSASYPGPGPANYIAFDSADNLYVSFGVGAASGCCFPEIYRLTAASGYADGSEIDPANADSVQGIAIDTDRDRLFAAMGGGSQNEQQEVTVSGAGTGTFELCFEGGCTGATGTGDLVAPATGTGDLSFADGSGQRNMAASGSADRTVLATGTGDRSQLTQDLTTHTLLATGTGDRIEGSTEITGLTTGSGAWSVGESISGTGIPVGAEIAAVNGGAGTLTMSAPATSTGDGGSVVSGSKVLTGASPQSTPFAVGESITGSRIPPGTTIVAVNQGAETVTLSQGVTAGGNAPVTSMSRVLTNVVTEAGAFQVGESIAGLGIPSGTTIAAVGAGTLTLSKAVTSQGTGGTLISGARTLANVSTDSGTFEVGQHIAGPGIPGGAAIVAAGAGTLTLSEGVSSAGVGQDIFSYELLATATGDREAGSNEITDLNVTSGAFGVGEELFGNGIPDNTTIAAVDTGAGTLTLSQPAISDGFDVSLRSGSKVLSEVDTSDGAFAVGQTVSGTGIPGGTTIAAVGADTLTLSRSPASVGATNNLAGRSTEVTDVTTDTGAFTVGQLVGGAGIPANTTIAAVGAGTLTLSQPPGAAGDDVALSAGSLVRGLTTDAGAFVVGLEVSGAGIPAGTRIAFAGPDRLALSQPVADASGVALGAEIPHDGATGTLDSALETLPGIDSVQIGGSPGAWTISFTGSHARLDLEELTCDGAELGPPGASCEVTTLQDGDDANRVVEYDLSTTPATVVSESANDFPTQSSNNDREFWGVAIDRAAELVYVSDVENGQVHVLGTDTDEPEVSALAPTGVTGAAATARGTVNPNGFALGECAFEYVTEAAFDQTAFADLASGGEVDCATADGSPIAGPGEIPADSDDHTVTASLSGLDAVTQYRYRLVATNGNATRVSTSAAFTTPGPPLVSNTRSQDLTVSGATLLAEVDPQGAETTVHFEYVTQAQCDASVAAEGAGHCFDDADSTGDESAGSGLGELTVDAPLASLAEGTQYAFRAVAESAEGTATESAQLTTLADPPTATTGGATGVGQTTATLNATVNGNGTSAACEFQYGATAAYGSSVPCSPSPVGGSTETAVSAAIAGLSPGTTYHFRVVATNAGGTDDGGDATFETAPSPPLPPGPGPGPGPAPRAGVAVAARVAQVRGPLALLRLTCSGEGACRGTVTLSARVAKPRPKDLKIGAARFAIGAGQSKTQSVRLNGKGRRLVRRAGRRGLKASLAGSGVRSGKVVLKPAKRKGKRGAGRSHRRGR